VGKLGVREKSLIHATPLMRGAGIDFPTLNYILVGNGSQWVSVPMSGDASIVASGAITVSTVSKTATASGTNTYTATLAPVPAAYISGVVYTISFTNGNTGAATLNLNSLGAKAIQLRGAALTGNEIPANATLSLLYDGTQFQIIGRDSTLVSAGTLWLYKAKTSATSGYPGDGFILWDNATQTSATHLLFAHLTNDNIDIDLFLSQIASGNTLVVQDQNDSTNYQKWTVSGSPTNTNGGTSTSYWTVPVTLVTSAGTGTTGFSNNHALIVGKFSSGGGSFTGKNINFQYFDDTQDVTDYVMASLSGGAL
jgi:hypothetical protein